MPCQPTTITLVPQLLSAAAIAGTLAVPYLLSLLGEQAEKPAPLPGRRTRAAGEAPRAAAPAKPSTPTRMRDTAHLRTVLEAMGRKATATDGGLVLSDKAFSLSFAPDAAGSLVATLVRGDAAAATRVLQEAQGRYLETVRAQTLAGLEARAPAAGWQVASRDRATDGSVRVTLARPREKQPVAIVRRAHARG